MVHFNRAELLVLLNYTVMTMRLSTAIRFLIIIMINASCFKPPEEAESSVSTINNKVSYEVNILDAGVGMVLELDSVTPTMHHARSLSMQVYSRDSCDYLVLSNVNSGSIDFYDLAKGGKICFRIKPVEQGPNGVGWMDGFYIQSMDSIYVVNSSKSRVCIIDSLAQLRKTIKLDFVQENKTYPISMSVYSFNQRMAKPIGGWLYMTGSYFDFTQNHYSERAVTMAKVNVETGESRQWLHYPPEYSGKRFSTSFYQLYYDWYNDNSLLLNYPASPFLYILKNDSIVSKVLIRSKFDKNEITEIERGNQLIPEMSLKHLNSNFLYSHVIKDEYRKLYYRFTLHPVKLLPDVLWGKGPEIRDFSIIVLDEDLNVIGESMIKSPHQYLPSKAIVSEEGLLIPESTENEDEIVFKKFLLRTIL